MDKTKIKQKMAKRIFLSDLDEAKKFPKYLMIEPTYACNAKCIMCGIYNHNKITPPPGGLKMSSEMFDNIVEEVKPYGDWIEMISLYGRGEPLLDRNIGEKIRKLKSIGIKQIQVSTNVALLTEEKAKELFTAGLNDLRFSIDSIRKERYESIRVGLKYDTVIKNAINALKLRDEYAPNTPIRIRAVAMEINKDEREEWLEFWKPYVKGIDMLQFIPYSSNTAREKEDLGERQYPCISPFSTFIIRANGDVALCCEVYDEIEYIMGNIKNNSIKEIWNNEKFELMRRRHLDFEFNNILICKGCRVWEDELF